MSHFTFVKLPHVKVHRDYRDLVIQIIRNGAALRKSSYFVNNVVTANLIFDNNPPKDIVYYVYLSDITQLDYALAYWSFYGQTNEVYFFGDYDLISRTDLPRSSIDDFLYQGLNYQWTTFMDNTEKVEILLHKWGKFYDEVNYRTLLYGVNRDKRDLIVYDSDLGQTEQGLLFIDQAVKFIDGSRFKFNLMGHSVRKVLDYFKGYKLDLRKNSIVEVTVRINTDSDQQLEELIKLKELGFTVHLEYETFNTWDTIKAHYNLATFCSRNAMSVNDFKIFNTMNYIAFCEGEDVVDDLGLVLSNRRCEYIPGFISNSFLISDFKISEHCDRGLMKAILDSPGVSNDLKNILTWDEGRVSTVAPFFTDSKHTAIMANARALIAMAHCWVIDPVD